MNKYWILLLLSWQNGLVYRTSVILWRFRQLLSTIMAISVWSVVFGGQQLAFGYSNSQMTTYILLTAFLQSIVLATVLHGLAETIYSGNLSNILLKPVNVFAYLGLQDVADKIKNGIALIIETFIVLSIFKLELSVPSLLVIGVFLVWVSGAMVLNFLVALLFGGIGFWSPETWGPRFLFFMFLEFTAGKLFPLDIMPKSVQDVVFLTPFPYFSFVQSQLFLQKLTQAEILHHSLMLGFWIMLLWGSVVLIWKKGLRNYSSAGR